MNSALLCLALVGALAAAPETAETPTTRLYVRTSPPGARITLNGKPLGNSNGLFRVSPGIHKLDVELAGYRAQHRQVEIAGGQITRLELALEKRPNAVKPKAEVVANQEPEVEPAAKPDVKPKSQLDPAAEAASVYVARTDVPESVREAMLTVLRQHPGETRWGGRKGPAMFAIAVKPLPSGTIRQRAVPMLLNLTHMLAVHELLKAKSLLDRYAATGLTDATTLRQAVVEAAGQLEVTGRTKGAVHQATTQGDFAVAYVVADESALIAHLLQPVALERVQTAYRNVMHRQARELMKRSNWEDALLLWHHLHKRKLVSQLLYLDAAHCFAQLGKNEDTVQVLTEAIDTFGDNATLDFLEKTGDIALPIETEPAQALAEKAYTMASEQLKATVTGPPTSAEQEP